MHCYYMLVCFHLSYILQLHHYLSYYKLLLDYFMKNMQKQEHILVLQV